MVGQFLFLLFIAGCVATFFWLDGKAKEEEGEKEYTTWEE